MVLRPEQENKVVMCSSCKKQFAIIFPKIQAKKTAPTPLKPEIIQVLKKQKTNWWQAPVKR
jgi:hypothetical protein